MECLKKVPSWISRYFASVCVIKKIIMKQQENMILKSIPFSYLNLIFKCPSQERFSKRCTTSIYTTTTCISIRVVFLLVLNSRVLQLIDEPGILEDLGIELMSSCSGARPTNQRASWLVKIVSISPGFSTRPSADLEEKIVNPFQ